MTSTTPTVTIRLGGKVIGTTAPGGVPASPVVDQDPIPTYAKGAHMAYFELTPTSSDTTARQQVMIFPALSRDGQTLGVRLLTRYQAGKGNRSRWSWRGESYMTTLMNYIDSGYDSSEVFIAPLAEDDFESMRTTMDTPQKAIRHMDKVLNSFGLSIK